MSCRNNSQSQKAVLSTTSISDSIDNSMVNQLPNLEKELPLRLEELSLEIVPSIAELDGTNREVANAMNKIYRLQTRLQGIIYESNSLKNEESANKIKKACNKEISKLNEIQSKNFPIFRRKFAKSLNDLLWENNIEVKTSGGRGEIISFTGSMFANNKNIKDVFELQKSTLYDLKYKQVRFYWYENSEYTYYSLKPEKDTEPVTSLGGLLQQ